MSFDTTPLEYLEMADLAYQDNHWEVSTQYQLLLGLGWQVHTPLKQATFLRKGKGGYRGIVYIHEQRQEIVCAHRGTSSLSAIEADITLVVEQKVHAQVTEAIEVCLDAEIKELLANNFSLTFTGHSLGGFLATSCLYFCQRTDLLHSAGESLHYPKSKAVVFDPAGSQLFLSTLEPYAISHAGLGEKGIKNLNILHFVSLPNYVNAYAPHAGGTLYGLFPTNIKLKTMNPITYLKQTHSLSNLRHCFIPLNSDSLDAGYPKANQCRKMSDWPLIDLKELASLGTIFGAVSAPLKLGIDALQALTEMVGCKYQRVPYLERLGGGEEYRQALSLAINATKTGKKIIVPELISTLRSHYMTQNSRYDTQLHKLHFGKELDEFLMDYVTYLQHTEEVNSFARDNLLTENDIQLLAQYCINPSGELSLASSETSMFTFRRQVGQLFSEKKLSSTSVKNWIKNKIVSVPEDIESMKNRLEILENTFLNPTTDLSSEPKSIAHLITKFSGRYQNPKAKKKINPRSPTLDLKIR